MNPPQARPSCDHFNVRTSLMKQRGGFKSALTCPDDSDAFATKLANVPSLVTMRDLAWRYSRERIRHMAEGGNSSCDGDASSCERRSVIQH